MSERVKQEIQLVEICFGELEVSPNFEWFIVKSWKLVPGWNKAITSVLVLIPPGYPVTAPDNFFAEPDLRLANGMAPGNANLNQAQIGRQWLQFSFHFEDKEWMPHADPLKGHNLVSFLHGIDRRLLETN